MGLNRILPSLKNWLDKHIKTEKREKQSSSFVIIFVVLLIFYETRLNACE